MNTSDGAEAAPIPSGSLLDDARQARNDSDTTGAEPARTTVTDHHTGVRCDAPPLYNTMPVRQGERVDGTTPHMSPEADDEGAFHGELLHVDASACASGSGGSKDIDDEEKAEMTLVSTQSTNEVLRQPQASERRRAASNESTSGKESLTATARDACTEDTFGPFVSTCALHTLDSSRTANTSPCTVSALRLHSLTGTATSGVGKAALDGASADIGSSDAEQFAAYTSPDYPRMGWQNADAFRPYVQTIHLTTADDTARAETVTTRTEGSSPASSTTSPLRSKLAGRTSGVDVSAREGEGSGGARSSSATAGVGRVNEADGNLLTGRAAAASSGAHYSGVRRLSSSPMSLVDDPLEDAECGTRAAPGKEDAGFVPVMHFRPAKFAPRLAFRGRSDDDDDSDDDDIAEVEEKQDVEEKREMAPHVARAGAVVAAPILDGIAPENTTEDDHDCSQQEKVKKEADERTDGSHRPISAPHPAQEGAEEAWGDVVVSHALTNNKNTGAFVQHVENTKQAEEEGESDWGDWAVPVTAPSAPPPAIAASVSSTWLSQAPLTDAPHDLRRIGNEDGRRDDGDGEGEPANDLAETADAYLEDDDQVAGASVTAVKGANVASAGRKKGKNKSVSFSLNDNVVVPPPPPEFATPPGYFYAEPDLKVSPCDAEEDDVDANEYYDGDEDDELPAPPMMSSNSASALFGRLAAPRLDDGREDDDGDYETAMRKPRKVYFQSGFSRGETNAVETPASQNGEQAAPTSTAEPGVTAPSAPASSVLPEEDEPVVALSLPALAFFPGSQAAYKPGSGERHSLVSVQSHVPHDGASDDVDGEGQVNEASEVGVRATHQMVPSVLKPSDAVALRLPVFAAPCSTVTTSHTSSLSISATAATRAVPGTTLTTTALHTHDAASPQDTRCPRTTVRLDAGEDALLTTSGDEDEDERGDLETVAQLPKVWSHSPRRRHTTTSTVACVEDGERRSGEGIDSEQEEVDDDDDFGSSLSPTNAARQHSHKQAIFMACARWHRGSTASTVVGNNASSTFPYCSVGPTAPPGASPALTSEGSFLKSVVPAGGGSGSGHHKSTTPSERVAQLRRGVTAQMPPWALHFYLKSVDANQEDGRLRTAWASSVNSIASASHSASTVSNALEAEQVRQAWRWPPFALDSEDAAIDPRAWEAFPAEVADELGRLMMRKQALVSVASGLENERGSTSVDTNPLHAIATATDEDTSSQDEGGEDTHRYGRARRDMNLEMVEQFLTDASAGTRTVAHTASTGPVRRLLQRPFCDTSVDTESAPAVGAVSGKSPALFAPTKSRTSLSTIYDVIRALAFKSMKSSATACQSGEGGASATPAAPPAAAAAHSSKRASGGGGGGGFWSWGGTAADVVVQAALDKQLEQKHILLEQSMGLDGTCEASRKGLSLTDGVGDRGTQHGHVPPASPLENGLMLSDPVMLLPGYATAPLGDTDASGQARPGIAPSTTSGTVAARPSSVPALSPFAPVPTHSHDAKNGEDGDNPAAVPETLPPAMSLTLDQTRDFSEIFSVATPSLRSPAFAAARVGNGSSKEGGSAGLLLSSEERHSPLRGGGRRARVVSIGAAGPGGAGGGGGGALFDVFRPSPHLPSPLTNSLSVAASVRSTSLGLPNAHTAAATTSQSPQTSPRARSAHASKSSDATTVVKARPSMCLSTLHALYPISRNAAGVIAGGDGVAGSVGGGSVATGVASSVAGGSRRRSLLSLSAGQVSAPRAVSPLSPMLSVSPFSRAPFASTSAGNGGSSDFPGLTGTFNGAGSFSTPGVFGSRGSAAALSHASSTAHGVVLTASLHRPKAVPLQQQWQSIALEQSVSASGVPEDVLTVLQLEEARRHGRRGSAPETLADVLSASQRRQP